MIIKPNLSSEESKTLFEEQRRKVVKGIHLISGVRIRLATKEDLEDLNTICLNLSGSTDKYPSQTFVLVKSFKDRTGNLDELMKNIVLALRLLKGGYVSRGHIFHILLPKKHSLALTTFGERPRRYTPIKYGLEFEEIPNLRKLLKKMQAVDFNKRKSLGLACRRFQRGYEEENLEDRLIDFIIAFESLFIRKEVEGASAKQKIANGCSTLLGKTDEEREEIRQILTEAYLIRNLIVHGSEYKKPADDVFYISDLVPAVEDLLRESIKSFLE